MDRLIERITGKEREIALIVRATYRPEGIEFLTDPKYSQQLAFMAHSRFHRIKRHQHNPVSRFVEYTQETLIVRKGIVWAEFYDVDRSFITAVELHAGDLAFLIAGGHGFTMLEDSELIEVKQGPYAGDKDKTVFE